MPMLSRVLFPVLSCFGPMFLVLGLQGPVRSPMDHTLAFCGSFMITAALLILYFGLARRGPGKP